MIFNKRIVLKRWEEKDKKELFKLASNVKVSYPSGFLPHLSEKDSENVIKTIFNKPEHYKIKLRDEDVLIGSISLKFYKDSDLVEGEDEAEIGFWLGEDFWGHGYMKEAAVSLIEYAFSKLQIKKIWASCVFNNFRSFNLQQSLGFDFLCIKSLYISAVDENRISKVSCLVESNFKKANKRFQN